MDERDKIKSYILNNYQPKQYVYEQPLMRKFNESRSKIEDILSELYLEEEIDAIGISICSVCTKRFTDKLGDTDGFCEECGGELYASVVHRRL